jgi:GTPase SAR1 family protein
MSDIILLTSTVPPHPIACMVIGMAGSGKTTLLQVIQSISLPSHLSKRLSHHLKSTGQPNYVLNLDPAVKTLPYSANIDIRDTIKYKDVMKQYNLGIIR